MRFQFIRDRAVSYRVESLCRVLGVTRSGYYGWRKRPPSRRQQANEQLVAQIINIHRQSKETYGSPRIVDELKEQGISCSRNRVARLMRLHNLHAKTKRRFKVTTRSCHRLPLAADLLRRDFRAPAPNRVWTSDITYLWTREGWVYLAVVLDLYSRFIVGWELSDRLTTDLVTTALQRALDRRQPEGDLVFHSDRGSQYASEELHTLARCHAIRLSMGATGSCYDNAVTESFFHTLKTEKTYFERYETREQARQSIFQYIEVFYNRQRRHSTNGNLSPWRYEQQNSP